MDLPSVVVFMACASAAAAVTGACALHRRPASPHPRRGPGAAAEEARFAALHTIARASPPLRGGLNRDAARRSAGHLRSLLGAEAVALVSAHPPDEDDPGGEAGADPRLLAWDGAGADRHAPGVVRDALPVLASGRPRVVTPGAAACNDPRCALRVAAIAPLTVEGRVEGALAAYWPGPSAARVKAVGEAARWVTGQLELAELDASRVRLAEAETRALRAQISPHFVYNSLTTIASFVRTDPARARALLLDFADFARYSFRNPRDFTTLADELRSIDRYLLLERARFGERLRFTVEVAPEVLPVAVPFLALQPLVENAVRHGMQGADGDFHISIVARDSGAEAAISVEDDGAGMDPERLQEILSAPACRSGARGRGGAGSRGRHGPPWDDPPERPGSPWGDDLPHPPERSKADGVGIGLANVDERMRQVYGEEYGLTVETAPGAGTKVNLRVPKYRPGVFPD